MQNFCSTHPTQLIFGKKKKKNIVQEMVEVLLLCMRVICGNFGLGAQSLNFFTLCAAFRVHHGIQIDYPGFTKILNG